MNVPKDPQVTDVRAIKREYGSSVPPDVPTGRRQAEELSTVVAMKAQLAEDFVALLPELEDVGRASIKCSGDKLDIPNELRMTNQLRAKGSSEGELGMEEPLD
jgi:hypothetical protein